MNIQRGTRDKLEKYVDLNQNIEVLMEVSGGAVYDYCCLAWTGRTKLSDDRYMVFYNQKQSPRRRNFLRAQRRRGQIYRGAEPSACIHPQAGVYGQH